MPLNGRVLFTLVMLAIFVTMVAIALGYPPLSRFVPLVIGIPGIVLTLGQLVVDLRELRGAGPAGSAPPDFEKVRAEATPPAGEGAASGADRTGSVVKRELIMFACFFGLVAGIILFGFWLTIPVFIILFLRLHERENWRFAVSLTAAGTAVLYLVFDRMLSIILHEGFITVAVLDRFAATGL